jgi:ABC-2 type transport system ATP-binding protein
VVEDAEKVRPLIGFMPDYFGSYPDLLVGEYLDFFARSYGLYGRALRRRVEEIVDFTEIDHLVEKRVSDLSKGMRQRISLGRTLLHDPQLLLLDEPAAGLDPQARRDLRELLKLLAQQDKTVLISSHILAELEGLVDRVAIIQEGRLVYAGEPSGRKTDGQAETLTLRVLADPQQAVKHCLEAPTVLNARACEPDILELSLTGGKEAIGEVVRRLVEAGQVPYAVVTEEKLLEDVFLEVTSGDTHGD